MAKLSDEQLRALLLLARNLNGCNEALLMAHGFPMERLEELATAGFAEASPEEMSFARRRQKVVCFWVGRQPPKIEILSPREGDEGAAAFTVTS